MHYIVQASGWYFPKMFTEINLIYLRFKCLKVKAASVPGDSFSGNFYKRLILCLAPLALAFFGSKKGDIRGGKDGNSFSNILPFFVMTNDIGPLCSKSFSKRHFLQMQKLTKIWHDFPESLSSVFWLFSE